MTNALNSYYLTVIGQCLTGGLEQIEHILTFCKIWKHSHSVGQEHIVLFGVTMST